MSRLFVSIGLIFPTISTGSNVVSGFVTLEGRGRIILSYISALFLLIG